MLVCFCVPLVASVFSTVTSETKQHDVGAAAATAVSATSVLKAISDLSLLNNGARVAHMHGRMTVFNTTNNIGEQGRWALRKLALLFISHRLLPIESKETHMHVYLATAVAWARTVNIHKRYTIIIGSART